MMDISSFIKLAFFMTVINIAPGLLLNGVVATACIVFGLLQLLYMLDAKSVTGAVLPTAPSTIKPKPIRFKLRRLIKIKVPRRKPRILIIKYRRPPSRALVVHHHEPAQERALVLYRSPLSYKRQAPHQQLLLTALSSISIHPIFNRSILLNWDFNTTFRPFVLNEYCAKVWQSKQFGTSLGLIMASEYLEMLPKVFIDMPHDELKTESMIANAQSLRGQKRKYAGQLVNTNKRTKRIHEPYAVRVKTLCEIDVSKVYLKRKRNDEHVGQIWGEVSERPIKQLRHDAADASKPMFRV